MSGNLTGLAAIVSKSRNQEPEQVEPAKSEQAASRPALKTQTKPEPEAATAKYSDPERVQLKAYVRRTTKVDAVHKWQREGRGDVSDLIETLLTEYLST